MPVRVITDGLEDMRIPEQCFTNDLLADELVPIDVDPKPVHGPYDGAIRPALNRAACPSDGPEGETAGEERCECEQRPVPHRENQTSSGITPVLSNW